MLWSVLHTASEVLLCELIAISGYCRSRHPIVLCQCNVSELSELSSTPVPNDEPSRSNIPASHFASLRDIKLRRKLRI